MIPYIDLSKSPAVVGLNCWIINVWYCCLFFVFLFKPHKPQLLVNSWISGCPCQLGWGTGAVVATLDLGTGPWSLGWGSGKNLPRMWITEIISEVLSLFITREKKKVLFKGKNCMKCVLSNSHSSMSNSHDIDKIAISAWKMWQNWVLNLLLTFVFAAFLGMSWFLWEGVNFKLATLKMGEFSAQSSLSVEFLLKL